jgi:type I restriction-modification system DNA methylase subunit
LVDKFEADKFHYLAKGYLEEQLKVSFISPFFNALGWDLENRAGLPHQECEVIVERGESDTPGRPDYSFRIQGQTKFFVEAKAPSESLLNPRHILQAKNYVWNTKQVFFVILTNFENFRFYDASIVPDARKPEEGLLLDLKYSDYLKNVEKLWEFSRQRVGAGSLEAMLPRDWRKQRLRIPVDQAFLEEMSGWRGDLAKNIFRNNRDLTAKQLNELVQRLLDRIVFVRIAEDRHIIENRQLADAVDEWKARGGKLHLCEWLNDLFHRINEDFNGEIFKADDPSESIKIDSDFLATIIERLYPPKSPYRFDIIGVELLGSIYERYLGNTIRLTAKQVRIEEKPEVRHAGGVFYTPQHIVDYIVRNTVGKVIEGKTPKQIQKVHVVDPACGSGSFLIGAFQYLIDYHVRYLLAHSRKVRGRSISPDLIRNGNGRQRLSLRLKAQLLKNNLFGLDIDPQAVEITMMSLYLKALEGERALLPPNQAVLPKLKHNIVCANSLIDPDADDEGADRDTGKDGGATSLKAFDWKSDSTGFGRVMKRGGFDCVIGNPPYVRIQDLAEWAPREAKYYKQYFRSAKRGNFDLYIVFLERGLSVLRPEGLLGFIVPRKFMQADYGKAIRALLSDGQHVKSITNFSNNQVFADSFVNTCVLILGKTASRRYQHVFIPKLPPSESLAVVVENIGRRKTDGVSLASLPSSSLSAGMWTLASREELRLLKRLKVRCKTLEQVSKRIFQGLKTGADKVYIVDVRARHRNLVEVFSKHTGKIHRLETTLLKPLIKGGDSDRFCIKRTSRALVFPYVTNQLGQPGPIEEGDLRKNLPLTCRYLRALKGYLERREGGITKGVGWYRYTRSQNLDVVGLPKIITPDLAEKAAFSYDPTGEVYFAGGAAGGYGILPKSGVNPKYLLGLLNSKVVDWCIQCSGTQMESGYHSYEARFIRSAPIAASPPPKVHGRIVALVDRMLKLNKKKHWSRLAPSELDGVEREIAATEGKIDALVYKLYGITKDERRIIEAAR